MGEYVYIFAPSIVYNVYSSNAYTYIYESLCRHIWNIYRDIHMKYTAVCKHTHSLCIHVYAQTWCLTSFPPFYIHLHLCIDSYIFIYIVLYSLGMYIERQTQIKPILYTSVCMSVHF